MRGANILIKILFVSVLLWCSLYVVEAIFKPHAAPPGAAFFQKVKALFGLPKKHDYSECSRFYHECFSPLSLSDEPKIGFQDLQEFMSWCHKKRGTSEHEKAGTAYTLCMKLCEVLRKKAELREELQRIMEREYDVLSGSVSSTETVYTMIMTEAESTIRCAVMMTVKFSRSRTRSAAFGPAECTAAGGNMLRKPARNVIVI